MPSLVYLYVLGAFSGIFTCFLGGIFTCFWGGIFMCFWVVIFTCFWGVIFTCFRGVLLAFSVSQHQVIEVILQQLLILHVLETITIYRSGHKVKQYIGQVTGSNNI